MRVKSILKTIEPSGLFTAIKPRPFPDKHLHAVHDEDFVSYLKRACAEVPAGKSLYPYIFPIRNKTRPPREPSVLSGYYCIDTFTPINANAYLAARRSVDCALTGAREILDGRRIAYALIRPPGHHAERRSFGGFCYFNNNAVAAQYLCAHGKVAILDVDYHHGQRRPGHLLPPEATCSPSPFTAIRSSPIPIFPDSRTSAATARAKGSTSTFPCPSRSTARSTARPWRAP